MCSCSADRHGTDENKTSTSMSDIEEAQSAEVPSRPGRPSSKRDRGIYATVTWTPPEDDGGADITGYVIKYGDEETDDIGCATVRVAGNTTGFQFTDQLQELKKYRFAVAAENTAGLGEFSEFSEYVSTAIGKGVVIM